jgi:electron transport complex protein RnfA
MTDFLMIMLGAALINNLVLGQLLGVSSVFRYDSQFSVALTLALFTAPVMLLTGPLHYLVVTTLLAPLQLVSLELIGLVLVSGLLTLACLHVAQRAFPISSQRHRLMLLMTAANSAVLGAALLGNQAYADPSAVLAYSVGSAAGFVLILLSLAALRERLSMVNVPMPFRGLAIYMIAAGLAAMALQGLAGIV